MKRRAFFKTAVAGAVGAPLAAGHAVAARALWFTDPLAMLQAWIEACFACEQGLLGAWADEEGKLPYVTFRLGAYPDRYPGGEEAAKFALVKRLQEWLSAARGAETSRPVLIWRSPVQFHDETLWEKKLGNLIATREQIEDSSGRNLELPDKFEEDEFTGNYYDMIERIPVRTIRIRARLCIPGAQLLGVPEGAPLDMI